MSAIKLRNVIKNYGAVQVVHGVDLDIDEGEFVVLLGPSGCGKTTTLRMVAGLEDVSGGELSIGGKIVNDVAPKDRGVAMVFQNYALYPHMSVRKNMEFALRPLKLEKHETEKRISDTAAILGLGELLERRPAQLSGGQRQRVAMGRAMVRTPKVFLFDEPLSNLDAKLRTQVRWEIGKLHQRLGTTVLYVTHDQVEAMTLADKVVIMRDGCVEQVGTPEEVYTAPKSIFVATFIGSPSMNMIMTQVAGGRLEAEGLSIPVPERFAGKVVEGQAVTVGVRPIEIRRVEADVAGATMANVEVTEYLGNEALLDLRVGIHELVAEVPADQRVEPGEAIYVTLNESAVHLFDTASGRTLAE
ncbi:MAG: sn-glycerol-3-phosphate ABC transporter ATP-binding protein UgpC [Alphaproteobacteria bacterium]|nr:sn-glycerol-3-phosphate ABC transporter ATP-binding protein UgpC [Alphaproteobacteria bacterium]